MISHHTWILDHLFKVNNTDEQIKLSMLITLRGPELYGVMKSQVSPKKSEDVTFAVVTELLKNHFNAENSQKHSISTIVCRKQISQ